MNPALNQINFKKEISVLVITDRKLNKFLSEVYCVRERKH